MIEARNGKPGTGLPWNRKRPKTYINTRPPKAAIASPRRLVACSGNTEKPVIMLIACVTS